VARIFDLRFQALFIFIVINIVSGCSGISICQNHDKETDFAALKTYSWEADLKPNSNSRILQSQSFNEAISHLNYALARILHEGGRGMINSELYYKKLQENKWVLSCYSLSLKSKSFMQYTG